MPDELPDLFCFDDSTRVRSQSDWPRRRKEIAAALIPTEYGNLPPRPVLPIAFECEWSHSTIFPGASLGQCTHTIYEGVLIPLNLTIHVPDGGGPFPVIVTGDGCWPFNDKITREVLSRGVILAKFDREAFLRDDVQAAAEAALRELFPGDYGAITAWAWAYHRVIDSLLTLPEVDPQRIAVFGHSRGGKSALLAGATDERIAVTCANQSGCGGAGSFRWQGGKSETLADILRQFPHWFAPDFGKFVRREDELPFDQHSLKALIAPRALLTTEALGDLWANPEGTWQTHRAAREAYRFLGAEEKLGIRFRAGPHDQTLMDWQAALDFMQLVFAGKKPDASFTESPFDLPPAHAWTAPSGS